MGFVARARSMARSLGPVDSLIYGCAWCLHKLCGRRARLVSYHIVAQPVPESSRLPAGRGESIAVRRLDAARVRELEFPRPRRIIEYRLRQGATCFAAFKEEAMTGFLWLVQPVYDEDEVRCRFSPEPQGEGAWDFDVYVDPAYRLGPTFIKLWDVADAWLRERGVVWTMSRISSLNPDSIRSHRRLGARFLGRALFVRVLRMQLMISTLRPYVHLSVTASHKPLLRVKAPHVS